MGLERARRHLAEMDAVLKRQIATLAADQGDADLSGAVVPLALTDSDLLPSELFGGFQNDHQSALSYMLVADGWALLLCMKVFRC